MDVMLLVRLRMVGLVLEILVKKFVGISIELELKFVTMETILIIKDAQMTVQVHFLDLFAQVAQSLQLIFVNLNVTTVI